MRFGCDRIRMSSRCITTFESSCKWLVVSGQSSITRKVRLEAGLFLFGEGVLTRVHFEIRTHRVFEWPES